MNISVYLFFQYLLLFQYFFIYLFICLFSSKCDELLDLKRDHLDRISFLNKQVNIFRKLRIFSLFKIQNHL